MSSPKTGYRNRDIYYLLHHYQDEKRSRILITFTKYRPEIKVHSFYVTCYIDTHTYEARI